MRQYNYLYMLLFEFLGRLNRSLSLIATYLAYSLLRKGIRIYYRYYVLEIVFVQ